MVSKNQSKFIKSLKIKKYRHKERSFLVEGRKNVLELLDSDFELLLLLGTEQFLHSNLTAIRKITNDKVHQVSPEILTELGTFTINQDCLAVARMRERKIEDLSVSDHMIVLDGIGDPGNLGTIIRTLDWFGFNQLVCSKETAEFYNPKTINSTMGSFTRVSVYYTDLEEFLVNHREIPVYTAEMEGEDPSKIHFPKPSIVVMGSESHGVSEKLLPYVTKRISIPRKGGAESLNVGIAAGIITYLLSR